MAQTATRTYTQAQVDAAVNGACNAIEDAIDLPDQGVRDALNLMVNATLHLLDHPDDTIGDVIAGSYQIAAGEDGPLQWIDDNC